MLVPAFLLSIGLSLLHPRTVDRTAGQANERWRYVVETDRFTHAVSCKLSTRGARFSSHVLTLTLGRSVDTREAWYQKDDGNPAPWRTQIPALIRLGARLQADDLDNPSGGELALPEDEVRWARVIIVRANAHAAPRVFKIEGLGTAIDKLAARGCWTTKSLSQIGVGGR